MLLGYFSRKENPTQISSVLAQMSDHQVEMNEKTFLVLLDEAVRRRDPAAIEVVVKLMEQRGSAPVGFS